MNDTLVLKIANLPESPGCYQMKENGKIIYVGKAVNLKNRVRSYFCGNDHTPKVQAMISHITDFDIILCRTNLEALILECNLIKLYKPYYNILLKDDKQYPYIRVDLSEEYPRIGIARRRADDGAKYFGPYIGASAVRDVMETLRNIFPIRSCKQKIDPSKPSRPCVNYEIGKCLAPCAAKCTQSDYAQVIGNVCRFLSGKHTDILDALNTQMRQYAITYRYEQAAKVRDQIRDIEGLMQRQQAVQTRDADQDVIALAQDGLDAMAEVLLIRGGKMTGAENFVLSGEGYEAPSDVLFGFLLQYYEDRIPASEVICAAVPKEIRADVEEWLRYRRGASCTLTIPQRGEKRALALMSEKNAVDALKKRNARASVLEARTSGACEELQQALRLSACPRRIECFDISNTQGELSVASMAVFIDGVPAPGEYRHFRIRTVSGPNDFESLAEVIGRRFARSAAEDEKERWPLPDMVLIDGGPVQLEFSLSAMREQGFDIPMFSLAERMEELFTPLSPDSVLLDRHSNALYLIQRIRDEAHRFAITYHRSLRTKKQTHSQLEDIPGIGPARRKALLSHFKTIRALNSAPLSEICRVKGISEGIAHVIYEHLHPSEGSQEP